MLEEEEGDPEWGDFDPEKETSNFFGRVIDDEKEFRADYNRRMGRDPEAEKEKKEGEDIEDELDEMFFEEMEKYQEQNDSNMKAGAEDQRRQLQQKSTPLAGDPAIVNEEDAFDQMF